MIRPASGPASIANSTSWPAIAPPRDRHQDALHVADPLSSARAPALVSAQRLKRAVLGAGGLIFVIPPSSCWSGSGAVLGGQGAALAAHDEAAEHPDHDPGDGDDRDDREAQGTLSTKMNTSSAATVSTAVTAWASRPLRAWRTKEMPSTALASSPLLVARKKRTGRRMSRSHSTSWVPISARPSSRSIRRPWLTPTSPATTAEQTSSAARARMPPVPPVSLTEARTRPTTSGVTRPSPATTSPTTSSPRRSRPPPPSPRRNASRIVARRGSGACTWVAVGS
ncbi:hypothetical protein GCM10020218_002320 [Dactylosporangium vinaceum]